ncbi:tyrosine-type recombinase/integrase [Parahaliea maris]|uniref:Tyrosine-type recombinase/integrase n=1 Tax=Parahaliea maris TaxID=2716870 RepID=A0A5C8ZT96_9GAMM|nr:site-specific integrase [Parahaliea maris]TXS90802.1 tyrosine-type recombinase/integrase [Parahaliea maris]
MPAKVLDDNFIENGLICPPGRQRIEYTDINRTGLYIEVSAVTPGVGTYWYRYKDANGKTARVKVGRSTDVSIKDAKAKVKELKAKTHLGEDPAADVKAKKQVPTLAAYFEDTYLPHAKVNKRSWPYDKKMYDLRIKPRFGHIKLNQLRRADIQQFHNELGQSELSPATADHHLKLIRRMLNLAVEWDLIEKNPAIGVKQFNADNREERLMSDEELQRLLTTLDKATHRQRTVALIVKFLLFTGARVNEALNARWSEIDRKNRTWTIQARTSKSKRRRSVPLNDRALDILDQLRTKGRSEWLFVSSRKGDKRMTSINKVWQTLRKSADLEHIRLHDLRHMHASMLVSSGHSLYVVQKVLGHSDPSVTQRYSHLTSEALREATNSVGDYVDRVTKEAG